MVVIKFSFSLNFLKKSQTSMVFIKISKSWPTEIGGILIPFSPTNSLLWRMFLFSPSGPATAVTSSNQCM